MTKLFQVVPLEAPGLVDVTTWLLLGSSLTMVCDDVVGVGASTHVGLLVSIS